MMYFSEEDYCSTHGILAAGPSRSAEDEGEQGGREVIPDFQSVTISYMSCSIGQAKGLGLK